MALNRDNEQCARWTHHLITVLGLGGAVLLHAQLGVLGLALALLREGGVGGGGVVGGSVVTHCGRVVVVREGDEEGENWRRKRESGKGRI